MANFYKDNEDLQFYIEKWIDWSPLLALNERQGFGKDCEFASEKEALDVYKDMLELVGTFAAEEIAPKGAEMDRKGLEYKDGDVVFPKEMNEIFAQLKNMELHGMCIPRELGGMNLPILLYMTNIELMARADVSTVMHYGFHGAMGLAMLAFCIDEGSAEFDKESKTITKVRFERELADIASGNEWGCMDITEPDAGSDMAALRTKAVQDADGNWFITGQKIFITSGHGRYHFVIARTEDAKDPNDPFSGLNGLSFFLCETFSYGENGEKIRHATVDRIEEKMGIHASPTCTISFDKTPAQLIGKRGDGFKHMLLLMNGARVGVASISMGLCESAYRTARDYAAQRKSMGKTIDQHEMIADMLDEMRNDIQAIRAMTIQGAYYDELSQKSKILLKTLEPSSMEYKRVEKDVKFYAGEARKLTPLMKYLGSEKSVEMSRRCVQIHGGSGFTQEYGAEKLLRDSVILPIYEGTSQIQALMAMKDTLGAIIKNPQGFLKTIAQTRWLSVSARDPLERRVAKLQSLNLAAQQHLIQKIATRKFKTLSDKPMASWPKEFLKNWDPKRDFAPGMLHAERLIKLLCDSAVAELLYAQVKKFPERREVLETFLDRAEPRDRFLLNEITTTGDRILAKLSGESVAEEKIA
ncbi:MAG: acyl-CoA dehydrogenase family protein [SAR324 cluster bacterium]|nr:acyl-CoA dehydrogenase family protein [SAR324 cluster bacterium]